MKKSIFSWARTSFWEKQEKYFQEKENLSWGRRRGSASPRRTSSEIGYFLDVSLFLSNSKTKFILPFTTNQEICGRPWCEKCKKNVITTTTTITTLMFPESPKKLPPIKISLNWSLAFVCQKNLVSIENLRILFMAVIAWYHRCHLLLMRKI